MRTISVDTARRIALAAQGLTRPRPKGRIDRRHFRRAMGDMKLLQLDSVNVLARSHYLPVYARLGPYDVDTLDAWTSRSGEVFEYWAHEASIVPVAHHPLLRWRMEEPLRWRRYRELMEEHPGYIESVRDEIAAHGPLTVSDLADSGERQGPWWGYGKGKIALEALFAQGEITAYRNGTFGRVYDLPERVVPREILDLPTPPAERAHAELLMLAAEAHGIGTAADLIDYYRLHGPTVRPLLTRLADHGRLEVVQVPGWKGPVYLHPEATRPRTVTGSALLSPFDPVVWNRDRAERLFDFRYRIEIYVPQAKRVHGYYVLPYLLDGRLVGRVDLKLDRKAGRLLVHGAFHEDDVDSDAVARALAADLRVMATWLGADEVAVGRRGNLVGRLRALVG
jgi:uncharacterized protein YcaQ